MCYKELFFLLIEEDDVFEILDLLQSIESRWYHIAKCLKLLPSVVDKIRLETSDHRKAMARIIDKWLQLDYDVKRHGPPTWRVLVEAVAAPEGGNDTVLAEQIARKHPVTGDTTMFFSFVI